MNDKSNSRLYLGKLYPFIQKHIIWLVIAVMAIIIEVFIGIIFAQTLKGLTDSATNRNWTSLKIYIIMGVIVTISDMIIKLLRTYSTGRLTEYTLFDIREKTLKDINQLTMSYLDEHASGDIVSRVTNDLVLIQNFLQGILGDLLATPLRVIVSGIFLFIINWKLAIFSLVTIPLLIFITVLISKPVEKFTKQQQEELGKVNSIAQDCIDGIAVTKAFTLEKIMEKRYEKSVDDAVGKGLKLAFIQAVTSPFGMILNILPVLFTFSYGGYLGIQGQITFGSLLGFIILLGYVTGPLTNIRNLINGVRSASAGTERLNDIWKEVKERNDGETFNIEDEDIAIAFHNVNFAYKGKSNILNSLSLDIKSGETVAIVGPSGCGKSTILKLITGFYFPQNGSISIYNYSISTWKLSGLRDLISVVSQDSYLFPEDIYTNICYGTSKANMESVVEAAKAADIHDFIESLPDKYYTLAGERGVKLSGGQKQRIAIARALLKNAPILLLDEATSALDTESEGEVQKALVLLMKGKTTLVVAHRLSTIKNADRILVVNEGHIVEQGTHEELLRENNLYSQLYSIQFQSGRERCAESVVKGQVVQA